MVAGDIILSSWQHSGDSIRISHNLPTSPPLLFPKKTIAFIPSGAKTQKIKRIDHCKYNVRASKNAEKAFSTQWYLYICNGLLFLFSVCWLHVNEFNSFWEGLRGRGQKVVAYSDIVSAMLSLIIKWYRKLYHCTWWIYHYIVVTYRFSRCVSYIAWCTSRSKINLKVTTLISRKMTIHFIFTVR